MNWKLIWRGIQKPSMRNKLLAVFGILIVYRMLSHIPIPLAEPTELKQFIDSLLSSESTPQIFSVINVLSGGALASLSIMLVGLGPYINASIAMQVLARAIPKLEKMQKEGEYGRKKINQYTRIITLPIAVLYSFLSVFAVRQLALRTSGLDLTAGANWFDWLLVVAALTAGAMILMWLGELITERGIGNGISLLITVAIVSQLPSMFSALWQAILDSGESSLSVFGWFDLPLNTNALLYSALIIASMALLTVFVVYLNEAQRRIKLSYAKKVQGNRVYSDVNTFLPIKLISAGVVPIIFALAFLSAPQWIGQLMTDASSPFWSELGGNLANWFSLPGTFGPFLAAQWTSYIYPVSYFLLVVLFTYFYTSIIFSAKDISERLQRQGGFIENVRPGDDTQKYLAAVVNRLNFFGAISLGFLALTPIFAQVFLGTDQLALGGTSILILVAVALETLRQIESQALMVTYEDYEQNFNRRDQESDSGKRSLFRRKKKS